MKKLWMALVASITLVVGAAIPAGAITDGALDGDGHPYVGLMVAKDSSGRPLWRCSGTLISTTVFLTAGHCTESPAATAELWFDNDLQDGTPAGTVYPTTGEVSGTTHPIPSYDPNAFYLHDVGVVVLGEEMKMDTYAQLPGLNELDSLRPRRSTTFTAVGYGLQKSFPSVPDVSPLEDVALKVRMVAEPHLLQINTGFTGPQSLLLSNNANTGGTCFGDSGGPNFLGDTNVVAGVTSFGMNSTCGGTGGVFRVDRPEVLRWIKTFLPAG